MHALASSGCVSSFLHQGPALPGAEAFSALELGPTKVEPGRSTFAVETSSDESASTTRKWSQGADLRGGMTNAGGVMFGHDALGSVVMRVPSSGAPARTAYDAWGAVRATPSTVPPVGATGDRVGFTGHSNEDTGLVYAQQRWLDPTTGRFLSLDPVAGDLSDPLSTQGFIYGRANPARFTDPDGRRDEEKFAACMSDEQENYVENLEGTARLLNRLTSTPLDVPGAKQRCAKVAENFQDGDWYGDGGAGRAMASAVFGKISNFFSNVEEKTGLKDFKERGGAVAQEVTTTTVEGLTRDLRDHVGFADRTQESQGVLDEGAARAGQGARELTEAGIDSVALGGAGKVLAAGASVIGARIFSNSATLTAREVASVSSQIRGRGFPLGFETFDDFASFGGRARSELNAIGATDATLVVQGSAVRGASFAEHAVFDVGRVSDLDIAISSSSLLEKARGLGIRIKGGGTKTFELTSRQIDDLGLSQMQSTLRNSSGRPVNFIITDAVDTALAKDIGIVVP